ncbi:MAG: trigger factor [Thiotrichaceae bacterium]
MQVSVETTSNLGRRLTVGVPKEDIEREVQNRFRELARESKINGFRPGKVPMRVIEQKFGQRVRLEVISEFIQNSYEDALQQEKLTPAGEPKIDLNGDIKDPIHHLENLGELTYTATFEVYPELLNIKTEGFVVEKSIVEITEADVDEMLHKLREQRATWQDSNKTAAKGDRVNIDFTGTVDGAAFQGSEAKQFSVTLGKDKLYIPGLEDALIGCNAGDTRELDVSFAEDHPNTEIAGKTVHFSIKLNSVAIAELPEVTPEFIKALGVEDGSEASLRTEMRENMQREMEYVIKNNIKSQLMNALVAQNTIELPESLIESEKKRILDSAQRELKRRGASETELQKYLPSDDKLEASSRERVKLGLLISYVIESHKLQAHRSKVDELIERIALTSPYPTEEVIKHYYANADRMREIESMVLEDEVTEVLLAKAQITEVASSFDALMRPTKEAAEGEAHES